MAIPGTDSFARVRSHSNFPGISKAINATAFKETYGWISFRGPPSSPAGRVTSKCSLPLPFVRFQPFCDIPFSRCVLTLEVNVGIEDKTPCAPWHSSRAYDWGQADPGISFQFCFRRPFVVARSQGVFRDAVVWVQRAMIARFSQQTVNRPPGDRQYTVCR